jgi:hypothetical protein
MRVLLTLVADDHLAELVRMACTRAGWEQGPVHDISRVEYRSLVEDPTTALGLEAPPTALLLDAEDGRLDMRWWFGDHFKPDGGTVFPTAVLAAGRTVDTTLVPFLTSQMQIFDRSLSVVEPDRLIAEVAGWLGAVGTESEGATAERGVIEALYREVLLGLVENEYLKAVIAELSRKLAGVTGELTEAQLEIKTLEALHWQLDRQNEALIQELSKGRVQPESASLLARGIKFGAVSLVSLAITVCGTYAGTRAALPDEQVAQLQVTQQTIVNHCDQVIQVVGEGG